MKEPGEEESKEVQEQIEELTKEKEELTELKDEVQQTEIALLKKQIEEQQKQIEELKNAGAKPVTFEAIEQKEIKISEADQIDRIYTDILSRRNYYRESYQPTQGEAAVYIMKQLNVDNKNIVDFLKTYNAYFV